MTFNVDRRLHYCAPKVTSRSITLHELARTGPVFDTLLPGIGPRIHECSESLRLRVLHPFGLDLASRNASQMLDLDNTSAGAQALALRFYQNVGIAAPSFLPSCPPAVRSYSKTALVLDFYPIWGAAS